ncbi:MAG: T9SS type A sorting domain-containing protein [Bacteroidales bacterium]|nr:T9SS type A sorting domain-containing protein [Bacteroidales bacterium]
MKKLLLLTVLLSSILISVVGQTDTISNNIYQTDKKLGIGISSPFAPLSVVNDSNYISPNENTVIADFRRVYDNSAARFNIYGYPDTDNVSAHMRKSIMLYATGDAKDFIICASQPEGKIRFFTQTWANPSSERMRIDSIGNVGIGTTNPFATLSVVNNSNSISPNENTVIADFRRVYDNSTARFNIYGYPDTDNVSAHMRKSIMLYATGDAKDFIICASQPEGKIRFFTQTWANPSSERMRIDSIGNVGIGTTKPLAKLQIADGDIYLSDIHKGIIMKSPDGNCWRGTLNVDGQLIFEQILCPENVITYNPVQPISEKVEIFPNPAQNSVVINILDSESKNASYSLFNTNGQVIDYGRINNSNHVLDISKLDSGIYLIKVSDKKGNLIGSNKIIKN